MKGENNTSVLNKLEKELDEATEVYRTLFEGSPDAIIVHRDMKIILANRASAKLLDFSEPEEMLGRMVTDFIHPEFQSPIKKRREKLMDQGELDPLEQMNITDKGRTVYTEAKSVVVNYQGEPAIVTLARDITDKKNAIDEMNRSERMHRAILDEAGVGIGVWSTDGKLIKFNKTALKYIGGISEDYEGRDVTDIFGIESGSLYLDRINMVLADGGPLIFEDQIDLVDGPKYFRSNYTVIEQYDNDEKAVMIISDDITSIKDMERKLSQYNDSMLEAQRISNVGSWSFDFQTQKPKWTPQMYDIFGLEKADGPLDYDGHKKIIHPDYWEEFDIAVKESAKSGSGYDLNIKIVRPDGSVRNINTKCESIKDEKGNIIGLRGTCQDTTNMVKLHKELKESEIKYRTLYENMAQGVFYQRSDGKLIDCNEMTLEIFGLTRDQFLGKTSMDPRWKVVHEDGSDWPGEEHPSMEALRTGKPQIGKVAGVFNPIREETVWILINAIPQFRIGEKDPHQVFVTIEDVSKRKKAELRLAAVAGSLETMVNSTDEFIMVADKDAKPILFNDSYKRIMKQMLGLDMEPGINPHTLLDDPDEKKFWEDNHRRVLSGESFRVDFQWPQPSGKTAYFDVLYHPIKEGDEITGFTEYTRDVTAIRDIEERLKIIVENSTNLIYAHDTEHKLTYLSPQVENILGYTPEEAMRNWTEMATDHPVNEIGFNHTMKAIETGEAQPTYELQLRKKDGSIIWVEVREAPVVENGVTLEMVGSLNDITERKRIREELEESEAKFRRLAENARDLIYRMSLPDGKFEYVSPSAFDVTGFDQNDYYENQDLLIKSIHPDFWDYYKKSWISIVKGEMPPYFEYKIIDKEGNERWINQRNVLVKDELGNPIALEGIVTNVTKSKMAEERLSHLNDLLKAIRDVNQLITKERNRKDLLKGICETLIKTSAFSTSWIVTFNDGGKIIDKVQSGLGKEFDEILRIDEIKDLFICSERVLSSDGVVVFEDVENECSGCPISKLYPENTAWSIKLQHDDRDFGILTVSLPVGLRSDDEFKELFEEVASDISFALHSMDIEEQRNQKESELKATLNFTQNLIESANAIIVVLDTNADIITFNTFAEQLTGWKKEEVLGKNWFELFIPGPNEDDVKGIFEDVVTDKDNHPGNINPIRTRSGDLKLIKWGNTKIRDISGEVIQTLSIGVDITAQHEYQDMLRESEERFRLLAENSSDVIWTMDLEGNLLYVSPSVEKLRGYTPEEVMSHSLEETATQRSYEDVISLLGEANERERSGNKTRDLERFEIEQPCKDGSTIWTESIVKVIYDESDEFSFILGVTRDITAKKEIAEEREEERRRAEFYLDLLSHDIGNLHQGIFSALQIARFTTDQDRKELVLGKSEDLVRRSLKLVKNVLLLSRLKLKEPDLQPIDLEKVLHTTLDDIRGIYSTRNMDLTADIGKGLVVKAEPIVEEIFFNLLQNGVKFQDNEVPVVSIRARSEDQDVVVEVEDHGFGITDDHKEKLFKRFSPSGIGSQSGIGLSLVKELVNRYNGSIEVEDRVEGDHSKGVRFIVHLPLDK